MLSVNEHAMSRNSKNCEIIERCLIDKILLIEQCI